MYDLEHPDITEAHYTGYPRSHREPAAVHKCLVCGEYIYEGDNFYNVADGEVCTDCGFDYLEQFVAIAERSGE